MRGLLIKNKAEKISVAAYNYYGANFNINVFDQVTNTYIDQNLPMSESLEPIASFATTVDQVRTLGQSVISVLSSVGLSKGDRIQVGTYIYRIEGIDSVTPTNITLNKGLLEDLVGTEACTKVGNMGIYSLDLSVANAGTFLVQAKDSVFGLMHTDMITVAAQSVQQQFTDTNTNIDVNQSLITTSKSGWKVLV